MKIEGCSALVTGGGSGLGAAVCHHLAARGARVAVLDIDAAKAEAVAASIRGVALPCDITSEAEVQAALAKAKDAVGVSQILVNCAGIGPAQRVVGRTGAQPLDAFRRVIDVNLIGTFNVIRLVAQAMIENDAPDDDNMRGVIVLTVSVAAFEGQIGQAAYSASKGGLMAMTLPIAREFARSGIRVLAIAPGIFQTPLLENLSEEVQTSLAGSVPFPKRLGSPEDFAQLVETCITNNYLNGEVIRLDGALRLQ